MLLKLRPLYFLAHAILLCGFSGFSTGEQCLVSGGFIANWLLHEPLAITNIIKDFCIIHQISQKMSDDTRYDNFSNITPISYNQTVLLIGQVPTQELRLQAYEYARSLTKVKHVFNQIVISQPTTPWQRIQDMALNNLVRIKLMITSNVRRCRFQVYTDNKKVFILGKAEAKEADKVVRTIQNTKGVTQVIRLIMITD